MQQDRNQQGQSGRARTVRLRSWRVIGVATVAMGAIGFLAAGCGSEAGSGRTADTADEAVVTVPAYETSGEVHAAQVAEHEMLAAESPEALAQAVPGDGTMPPSIIVTASNTVVAPGEVIDIAVQATPDVTEMSLWDGVGDRQALAYDADARAWRVSYRVPLRLPWERTGLAVTAKNEGGRWCRSWLFIEMEKVAPVADTAGVMTQPLAKDVAEPGEH